MAKVLPCLWFDGNAEEAAGERQTLSTWLSGSNVA